MLTLISPLTSYEPVCIRPIIPFGTESEAEVAARQAFRCKYVYFVEHDDKDPIGEFLETFGPKGYTYDDESVYDYDGHHCIRHRALCDGVCGF